MVPQNLDKKINVIVNGAYGRMGTETVSAIQKEPNLRLVATLGKLDNLEHAIRQHQPQVVVDFTNAQSVYQNTKTIISNKACPIIGATGLLETQISELQSLAKKFGIGGLIVPNFSLGAILMMQFAQMAAKFYQQVEIIERHHPNKLDAPSGTAIRTADLILKHLKNKDIHNNKSDEIIPNALGANYHNIPIHSLRLSGSCAHQTVMFGGDEETLSITHESIHRKSFMPGVVLACQKVQGLRTLEVGLETILDL